MKSRHDSAACAIFMLVLTLLFLPGGQFRAAAADVISVYGINSSGTGGSWIEGFEITVDAQRRTATATEFTSFRVMYPAGGGILVERSNVYYSYHATGFPEVYLRGFRKNDVLFNARGASGYDGFQQGVGDISGDDTHIWANPWDGSNLVFEFIPAPEIAFGWRVQHHFDLQNAGSRYDGMEVIGDSIYANRVDAGFRITGMMPCASRPNGIYDKYSSDTGALVMAAFIRATFPASGIAFNGTYFFVSDICNNGIAVYARDGTFIAEATLPLPLPGGRTSVCVNPALLRCIEDLSILQSSADSAEASRQPTTTKTAFSSVPAD
jgi:hypothetical protein